MNCPKCHRDTYSKKWETCTACDRAINDKERLTDAINRQPTSNPSAINTPTPDIEVEDTSAVRMGEGSPEDGRQRRANRHMVEAVTPNRRSRESYNAYMKTYMQAYRERSRG